MVRQCQFCICALCCTLQVTSNTYQFTCKIHFFYLSILNRYNGTKSGISDTSDPVYNDTCSFNYSKYEVQCKNIYFWNAHSKYKSTSTNSKKLVILLHSLYWLIDTKDERKRGTAFAFIFGVNWLLRCGVTASFGVLFHEIECNGMTSFMEFMWSAI